MTASNGIRTEHKIKRLAAAVALALAAVLGASCLSPARADAAGTSDGNLVIDVPTTVPCALMADGTVVSPSEWKITTSGDAYIASASASGFPANVEWSAKTTDLAAARAGSVEVSGTGDAVSVAGPSDPAAAKLATTARFEWSFSKLDADKNSDIIGKAAGGTAVLGSVTFTFAKVEPDAFAVYSADDNSLSFYKRAGVPVAGQTFEGKTATEVYTGIETMTSIPGWTQNHFNDIKTVTVYDEGVAPTGTAFWFAGVRNLKTADISKLDMSRCKTIECMFTDCISLETLDLSGWDTSSLANMSQAFHHCASLTKLNVSGWDVSKVTNMQLAFAEDTALGSLDLSTWDNSATTSMKDAFLQMDSLSEISLGSKFKFVGTDGYLPTPSSAYIAGADGKWYDTDGNGYAPADIPSNKAMTYTAVAPKKAFAVYSADDGSLSFYKRAGVPSAGDTFEGKAATEVYEGVEDASYTAADGAPWSGHAADIASVTVADAGVSPVSTAYWFKGASKLKSVNLAGLDTSQTTCMDGMFDGCSSLEALDLSNMSTRRVASMTAFLGGCDSLAELSLGSEFAWVDDDCYPPTGDWKQGSTGTDYSESDIPANKTDKYTRTKTAFAVYSEDDQSLTFYKRFEAPAEGGVFEGKTATGVYTGFETQVYDNHSSNVPWLSYRSNVKTVTVADAGVAPVSTRNWFSKMTALKSADISKLDTRNLTTIRGMFDKCSALTALDLSSFDTSAVVDMGFVFEDCSALTSLDLSSFDTRNVADMSYLFYGCTALTSLDLSSFNTGNVTTMREIFMNCKSLTSLDLSSFDTGKVRDFYHMFGNCGSLTSLDLSSFDTSKVSQMYGTFQGCSALTSLDLSSFDTRSVENMSYLFAGCESLTSLDLSSFDTSNVEVMDGLFIACKALTSLDLSSFDTSNVMGMHGIFNGCSALSALDLSSFDTGNVTDMDYLFRNCSALQKVAFGAGWKWLGTNGYLPTPNSAYIAGADGKWYDTDGNGYAPADIPSNKAMTYTAVAPKKAFAVYSADDGSLNFYNRAEVPKQGSMYLGKTATAVYTGLESMTSAPGWMLSYGSSIKTVTVYDEGISPTDTGYWFAEMRNLKTADVSKLDMSKCKTISCMFTDCTSLETLDLSAWDTRSLKTMGQAFQNCTSLTELNVSGWDVSHVTNMDLAFAEDNALARLDLSTWDNSAVTTMKDAFLPMNSLSEISLGSKFKFVGTRPFLPEQTGHVTGSDGKWYDTDGNGYAPADIPSNKAMTYTAVAPKTAFAVYSADDNSLNFYKRTSAPSAGDQFEEKVATEVYEDVEKASYTAADGAPWAGHADELASVKVADAGVSPVSTAYWFKGASKLSSVNLTGLDTSQTTCMDGMFEGCSSLETLDLSAMSTRRVASMTAFLGGCDSLAELSLGSEFAWVDDDCYPPTGDWKQGSTGADYSESDIPANKTDKYTRTKTAFAVYSADDQSLTFYKRPVAPAEGAQFLGKTASKVFTGFETGTYSASSVPWAAYRSNLKTVTVADAGVAPVSTAFWFYLFTNATSIDLSKLDTGKVTSMLCTFYGCESLTTLNLSSFDTGNVTDMRSLFQDCKALTVLDLSSFDTGSVTNMICIFTECVSLERISLGTGFKWVGSNCYPRSGNWESSSTGKVYSAREIPSGVADTYVYKPNTKASTAVNAAPDPVSDEMNDTVSASTTTAQGENATQKGAERKPSHEARTSQESGVTTEPDGVEKDAEGKPAVENEATKEDVAAIVPEGAEKATAVKSGE